MAVIVLLFGMSKLEKLLKPEVEKAASERIMNADILKEIEAQMETVKKSQIDKDIDFQTSLFVEWEASHKADLNEQIQNFAVETRKEKILQQLNELERQEEMLTFFDNRQAITDSYHGKGFPIEDPAEIPLDAEEAKFKSKSERHFKPWPKYMNRPPETLRVSERTLYKRDSLRKIYLSNSKAQTTAESKLVAKYSQGVN